MGQQVKTGIADNSLLLERIRAKFAMGETHYCVSCGNGLIALTEDNEICWFTYDGRRHYKNRCNLKGGHEAIELYPAGKITDGERHFWVVENSNSRFPFRPTFESFVKKGEQGNAR